MIRVFKKLCKVGGEIGIQKAGDGNLKKIFVYKLLSPDWSFFAR